MEKQTTCDLCGKEDKLYHCKCGGKFRSMHRYSFMHLCDHDHKSDDGSKIYLPKIVADKIENI